MKYKAKAKKRKAIQVSRRTAWFHAWFSLLFIAKFFTSSPSRLLVWQTVSMETLFPWSVDALDFYFTKDTIHPKKKKKKEMANIPTPMNREESDEESGQSPGLDSSQDEQPVYDPRSFDNLNVSPEIRQLFSYITLYNPRLLDLDFKLKPFLPDFIPSVGDIDAFIKVIISLLRFILSPFIVLASNLEVLSSISSPFSSSFSFTLKTFLWPEHLWLTDEERDDIFVFLDLLFLSVSWVSLLRSHLLSMLQDFLTKSYLPPSISLPISRQVITVSSFPSDGFKLISW